jgi:hypothetical protein
MEIDRRDKEPNPLCDRGNHEARRNGMASSFLVGAGTATLGRVVRRGGESRRWGDQRRHDEGHARRTGR